MIQAKFDPTDPRAFPARDLAKLLTRNRPLMELYKESALTGEIRAIQSRGRNYVLVTNEEIQRMIRDAAPQMPHYAYDESTGEVTI